MTTLKIPKLKSRGLFLEMNSMLRSKSFLTNFCPLLRNLNFFCSIKMRPFTKMRSLSKPIAKNPVQSSISCHLHLSTNIPRMITQVYLGTSKTKKLMNYLLRPKSLPLLQCSRLRLNTGRLCMLGSWFTTKEEVNFEFFFSF